MHKNSACVPEKRGPRSGRTRVQRCKSSGQATSRVRLPKSASLEQGGREGRRPLKRDGEKMTSRYVYGRLRAASLHVECEIRQIYRGDSRLRGTTAVVAQKESILPWRYGSTILRKKTLVAFLAPTCTCVSSLRAYKSHRARFLNALSRYRKY